MPEDRRLAVIMFTDIVGYTRLMGTNEEKAVDMLSRNRSIHQSCIEKFNGTLIKEIGDGILASFSLASEAVRCGIMIQKECKEQDIPLKIGIHGGEMIFSGTDVIGDGVNIASRIQEDAREGCINISASVYRDIKNKADIQTKLIGEKIFKNVDEPIKVYKILLEGNEIDDLSSFDYLKLRKKQKRLTYYLRIGAISAIFMGILFWLYLPVNEKSEKEKSIAVMPFDNESDDQQNEYFVNGMMEDIRNNLSIIGDLRIVSKTSTEKYRDTNRSTKEIAEELGVNYLLEGTVQKQGNQVKIHAQLIEAEIDDHIWAETYLRDISEVFKVQSEIAQVIAEELYSTITPQEIEILESIPTIDLTAYDFFLRARDAHTDYWLDNNNREALENAIAFYNRALEYDSTYARAYTGLGMAYIDKHYWQSYFEEGFMDSVLVLSNKALSFNRQLDEAYYVRGQYWSQAKNEFGKALNDFNKAIQINPNNSLAYYRMNFLYANYLDNWLEGIINLHKAAILERGSLLPVILRTLSFRYHNVGFPDEAIYYLKEIYKLDNDSLRFANSVAGIKNSNNLDTELELALKWYEYDSTSYYNKVRLLNSNSFLGNYQEAYDMALSLLKDIEESEGAHGIEIRSRIGYAFWQVGKKEDAKHYFNEQIRLSQESIKLNRHDAINKTSYYDLAAAHAFIGDKEKAYQYLDEFNSKSFYPLWHLNLIKHDPLFNDIREEERFQKILRDMDSKFLKEHNRVKAWLEEQENGFISLKD